ncbi:hypothetical protein AB0P12_32280 [Streptomyces subrutilus]|uniref:hypothetical protein n=1 Tax=Streptomyces subrutilus TaxID=36818 RepID=UPI00341757FB
MAPAGFHRALAAHQAVPRTREMALDTAAAAARQARVLRELSQWVFPEEEEAAADDPAPIDSAVLQRRWAFAATETAALHRVRAERAQRSGAAVILPQAVPPHSAAVGAASSAAGCA